MTDFTTSVSNFFHKYTENIGGAVSLAGNFILIAGGKGAPRLAATSFFAAEGSFAAFGNTVPGYSAGAAFFSIGDLLLAKDHMAAGRKSLGRCMGAMGLAWAIGALRYPCELISQHSKNEDVKLFFKKTADTIPLVVSVINLPLRVPGIYNAFKSGDKRLGIAISCWAVSDLLTGRLVDTWSKLKASF